MYASFFGLGCLPFEDRADTQFYYPTAQGDEAVAALQYETRSGSGSALLLGETGMGKTLLLRVLLGRLEAADQAVVLSWPADGGADLLRECCKSFGVTLSTSQNHSRRSQRLRRHLTRAVSAGRRPILVIDQAENLSPGNLAQLATMLDLEGESGRLLRVILVAQPHVRAAFDRPELARVRQQFFGERTLLPLTEEETRAYIAHRLRVAGLGDTEIFDAEAIQRVHELSEGVPRLINRICNAALLGAYGAGVARVSAALVDEITGQPGTYTRSMSTRDLALPSADAVAAPWPTLPEPAASEQGDWAEAAPVHASIDDGLDDPPWSQDPPDEGSAQARLERAVAKAERLAVTTEASLSQLTAVERHLGTLLDRAEAVSKSFGPTIQHGIEAVERTERRFAQMLQHAQQGSAEIEARWSQATERMARMEDLLARTTRAGDAAARIESRLTLAAEQFANQADRVQGDVARLMQGLESTQCSQAALQELNERGAVVVREAAQKTQELSAAATEHAAALRRVAADEANGIRTAIQENAWGTLREVQTAAEGACTRIEAGARRAAESMGEAESRAAAASQHLGQSLRAAEQEASRLAEDLVRRTKAAMERETDAAATALNTAVQRTSEEVRTAQQASLDAAMTRTRTTMQTELVSVERAARDVVSSAQSALDAAAKRCSLAVEDAAGGAESVIAKLSTALSEARAWEADFERKTLSAAREQWRELAAGAEAQLEAVARRADELQSRRDAMQASVSALAAQTAEIEAKVKHFDETAGRYPAQIESAAATAAKTRAAIEGLVAHADEKIAKLASHHAAASSAAERLAGETLAADAALQKTTEQVSVLRGAAADAEQRISVVIEQVREAADREETCSRDLQAGLSQAGEQQIRLARLVDTAGHAVTELAGRTDSASEVAAQLAQRQADASALAERLVQVVEQLSAAGSVYRQLGDAVETARQVHDRLSASAESGASQVSALESTAGFVAEARSRLDESTQSAMIAADRLEGQLATHAARMEGIESGTGQLAAALEVLRTELGSLTEKAAAITTQMGSALDQPHAVLGQVQAQAQQLERVCGAVRKVFAALSQATLNARRQADELQGAGDQAVGRCTHLRDETLKAATVLREWVAEALHAQSRLQRSLVSCPSVATTHPLDAVHGLSRFLDDFEHDSPEERPALRAHVAEDETHGARPPSARAEEIARLIAEAADHEPAGVLT